MSRRDWAAPLYAGTRTPTCLARRSSRSLVDHGDVLQQLAPGGQAAGELLPEEEHLPQGVRHVADEARDGPGEAVVVERELLLNNHSKCH